MFTSLFASLGNLGPVQIWIITVILVVALATSAPILVKEYFKIKYTQKYSCYFTSKFANTIVEAQYLLQEANAKSSKQSVTVSQLKPSN